MLIARLKGQVEDQGADGILVDVGGVGYPVLVSNGTRMGLPFGAGIATLLIETHIREDAVIYYGFISRDERDWFRLLTNVQGVGGKVALAILSVFAPQRLAQTILAQDKVLLTRADGVGPKLAARLVTELKDKAAAWSGGLSGGGAPMAGMMSASVMDGGSSTLAGSADRIEDAVSALVNLGYRRGDALSAVSVIARTMGDAVDVSTLIRLGLKEISA